ncbi:sigma-70 family RNA polymerase sigma factor [Candidatus Poribacteria bacterium]|nr:sigma-70 family RNA polymerase sigma factor [Candidatus Poribacteria bacterium]
MEQENNVQLIRKILAGDDTAFSALVEKYQKSIHALVWRKIDDFHIAEELTQDTFLNAYKNLSTLKDPSQFAGWLYVIANRLCINWIQRNKSKMQSLASTPLEEIEYSSYNHYVLAQREVEATERRHHLVKTLLEKLPESERTVITLYYLGGMKSKDISKFLGVSVNTVTSRLQRARKRLAQEEELLVQEVLGGVHISTGLTQNIMRHVAEMKPTPPPTGKPLLPWMAFGTATVLVFLLMLGMSNQYLLRFQKPYSFEALSEPTIEIIDTPITLAIDSKPAVRTQAGRDVPLSENTGAGLQASENVLAPNTQNNSFRSSTSPWTQASGPQGSPVFEIFATSGGTVYATTPTNIYRLTTDAAAWTPINIDTPIRGFGMPMTEHKGVLYIVYPDQVLTSIDNGETWNALAPRPKGHAVGLVITDETEENSSQDHVSMYLALRDNGIFHSINGGKQWTPLNEGLSVKRIYAVAAVGNTVFAGTNEGLYRLNSGVWEQLPVEIYNAVHSLAVIENNLYAGMGSDPFVLGLPKADGKYTVQIVNKDNTPLWKIFHSTDLGASWTEITPKDEFSVMRAPRGVKILASGKRLLVSDAVLSFRSNDRGQTWTNLGFDRNAITQNIFPAVAVNENTFYRAGEFGIHRTTDAGASWHPFMNGILGTRMESLIGLNDRLFVHTGSDIVQSTDGGESWKSIHIDSNEQTFESTEQELSHINFSYNSQMIGAGGDLYGIVPEKYNLRVFRLSVEGDVLTPIQEVTAFQGAMLSNELVAAIAEAEEIYLPDDIERDPKLTNALSYIVSFAKVGGFAVSGETFYIEHQRSLFKWKPGDPKWINTGLIDLGKQSSEDLRKGFKLAVSGETVYVGKRAGRLFQSLDEGNSWKDITSRLPLHFSYFNEILFVGSTVYVATDTGVLSSQNGESWRVLTDGMGKHIVVDRFAVDGTTVYSAGDTGLYRLDTGGRWEQISPSVPDKVISLVINKDRLYIATQQHGIFHSPLPEEYRNELSQRWDDPKNEQ